MLASDMLVDLILRHPLSSRLCTAHIKLPNAGGSCRYKSLFGEFNRGMDVEMSGLKEQVMLLRPRLSRRMSPRSRYTLSR